MPNLPHLILPRAEFDLPRKKTGFGKTPDRDHGPHGHKLREEVEEVLAGFRERTRPSGIDPRLVLRIQLAPKARVDEEAWERFGLTLLSVDENRTLVLFSSDAELREFRRKLGEYQGGRPPGQKSWPHQQMFASISNIGEVRPEDRIGPLLRADGIKSPDAFHEAETYIVDLELWDLGGREANRVSLKQLREFIQEQGGVSSDDYVGESLVLLRSKCTGKVIKNLLAIDYVAMVDLPPKPTLSMGQLLEVGIEDLPEVPKPPEAAPGVAVLDSGLTAGHPLIRPAVGEATTVPLTWDDASDAHGHGTCVAGLALYGDVQECIESRSFVPRVTLYSARVLNRECRFDDDNLITTQMREAIQYFRANYGCRVFNLSLGDSRLPYRDGKVSPWASILDTLARELDVVVVVSAGNYEHNASNGGSPDSHLQDYPRYLLDEAARIIEPATGAIVLTVGALAHAAELPPSHASNKVEFRPIAQNQQPSPFTRCGPGASRAIKPELCEAGGNYAYDGLIRRTRKVREMSIISMGREYAERLFTTDAGTSLAAPKVAHAAARLYESFPDASANLIRALLVASARVPQAAQDAVGVLGNDAVFRLCGYGRPNLDAARASDDARVVLYAESALAFDNFHIYEIPIPDDFIFQRGTRRITVVLAYDPPVRHTRLDYLGVRMSFRLIRGKSAQEVAEAFRQRTKAEEKVDGFGSTAYNCRMNPKPTVREGGTLQKAVFQMERTPTTDYGNTYRLVVRCERKWARDYHAPQRYATVVVLEHSHEVDLYTQIRARIRETARLRARQ